MAGNFFKNFQKMALEYATVDYLQWITQVPAANDHYDNSIGTLAAD